MLNAKTIQTISDVVKYATRFKSMLLEWDSKRCRLAVTSSWTRRMFFVIIALYLSAEAMYQGCTLYSQSHKRTIPLQSYMKLVSHFFTRLCGLLVTLASAKSATSIATFFNQMLQTNQRFQVYFRGPKAGDKCARLLWIFKYFLYFQPLIPAFTYVNEYRDIRYWQGAVFPGFILPLIWPCFFVVEYWISFYAMSGPIFWGYIFCSHCFSTHAWLNILRLKLRYVNMLEWHRHRARNGSCTLHKGLQILNQMYNGCYANMLGWGLAACMGCLVLMLTFSIQLTPTMQFPGSLMFPVGALALLQVPQHAFTPTVKMTDASMAFVQSYRLSRNPVQLKAARTLMPLVIRVSILCVMRRSTVVEFYSQVINNTVSMLLI